MMKRIICAVVILTSLCSLLAVADGGAALKLGQASRSSVLKEDGYIVWGASMVQTADGTNHLFYCRWKGVLGDWYKCAEIVRATSKSPLGPFEPQEVVLTASPEGVDKWDGLSVYNPTVVRFGKKYYLYYSGSNGLNFPKRLEDGSFKRSPNGTLITQRIGVAVADDPRGPWKRIPDAIINPSEADGIDSQMVCNPSVTQGADGKFLMIYKCSDGRPNEGGGIYLTSATADSPTGPFKKTYKKILSHEDDNFPLEDPFVWWQDGKYLCLADDQRGTFSGAKGLVLFESKKGVNWKPSEPFVISRCEIAWDDGVVEPTLHFERPQIWLKDGKPAVLFASISKGHEYFNVHVPFEGYEFEE